MPGCSAAKVRPLLANSEDDLELVNAFCSSSKGDHQRQLEFDVDVILSYRCKNNHLFFW